MAPEFFNRQSTLIDANAKAEVPLTDVCLGGGVFGSSVVEPAAGRLSPGNDRAYRNPRSGVSKTDALQ